MKYMKLAVGSVMAFNVAAFAMPTQEQTKKVEPLVQDLMREDQVALKSGKKTRVEVAQSAMSLADKADSEAAKLLLMKGAFGLYVHDGNIEKAVETMQALKAAIPDLSPANIENMTESALKGADKKVDGARLRKLLDETNAFSLKATVDGYTWSYRVKNGEAMIIEEKGGRLSCAVSPMPKGCMKIPLTLGGVKVTCIGTNAFVGCRKMSSVIVPEGVTCISPFAFAWCEELVSVTIPSSMRRIETGAFQGCCGLASVTIPEGVTYIGPAFFRCSGLRAVRVEGGNRFYKSVNGLLLTKDGKTLIRGVKGDVTIPSGVTDIANGAFFDCGGLRSVKIPPSVSNIWQTAFRECGELKSITIPESVTHLGMTAFQGCNGLTSVTIPSSVKYVGKELFLDCSGLMFVTMRGEKPDSGKNVFCNCKNLKAIHVPANAKSWAGLKEWQGIPLVFDGKKTDETHCAK